MGGALARPSWLSSPTLGRANRFLSTAAVSLMTPRRPLTPPDKVKVRTVALDQRTEEDSKFLASRGRHRYRALGLPTLTLCSVCVCVCEVEGLLLGRPLDQSEQSFGDKSLLEIVDGVVMMYNLSVHQQLGKVSPVKERGGGSGREPLPCDWAVVSGGVSLGLCSRWWWCRTMCTSTPWPSRTRRRRWPGAPPR